MNDNFGALDFAAVYAMDARTTSALTWGYIGGRWAGFAVAAGALALTDDDTNYIVVARSDGTISVSTVSTDWDNAAAYARDYKVTAAAGLVTVIEDHRAGPGGVHAGAGASGATAGRHAVPISAATMQPSVTGGCAPLAAIASAANQPDIVSLDFDHTTQEFAQFSIDMPKSWNEGTVTFKAIWSHAATSTNFGVAWDLQAVAVSDNEAIDQAFGTAVVVVDTGGTTNKKYSSSESAAITIAGTPAAEDTVFFRLSRVPADAGDNLAVDARLHGIVIYITTDAENDA